MQKTKAGPRANSVSIQFDFEVRDKLRRKVGVTIHLFEILMTAAKDGEYDMAPGLYYAFIPHATRDSKPYGAIQQDRYFVKEALRSEALQTYLDGARKRASKFKRG